MDKTHLLASEVQALLGINRATLYAYVSRGLIRSEKIPHQRCNHYRAADVWRLKQKQEWRYQPQKMTEQALFWGEPLLDTAISLVKDGQLYYRGQGLDEIVANHSVEALAAWLWLGRWEPIVWPSMAVESSLWQWLTGSSLSQFEQMQALLPWLGHHDLRAYDQAPDQVAWTGAKIVHGLASVLLQDSCWSGGLAENLQQHWAPEHPHATNWFRLALMVCADHEMNISTFTARCAASSGAPPYGAIQAALAAFQGPLHGGQTLRFETLFRECTSPKHVPQVLKKRLQCGEALPVMHHPFYLQGDPRAILLLQQLQADVPDAPALAIAKALLQADLHPTPSQPTLDLALVVLGEILHLPPGYSMGLFALGRSLGWIAHILEQYQDKRLIRPRSRYVGEGTVR